MFKFSIILNSIHKIIASIIHTTITFLFDYTKNVLNFFVDNADPQLLRKRIKINNWLYSNNANTKLLILKWNLNIQNSKAIVVIIVIYFSSIINKIVSLRKIASWYNHTIVLSILLLDRHFVVNLSGRKTTYFIAVEIV